MIRKRKLIMEIDREIKWKESSQREKSAWGNGEKLFLGGIGNQSHVFVERRRDGEAAGGRRIIAISRVVTEGVSERRCVIREREKQGSDGEKAGSVISLDFHGSVGK